MLVRVRNRVRLVGNFKIPFRAGEENFSLPASDKEYSGDADRRGSDPRLCIIDGRVFVYVVYFRYRS